MINHSTSIQTIEPKLCSKCYRDAKITKEEEEDPVTAAMLKLSIRTKPRDNSSACTATADVAKPRCSSCGKKVGLLDFRCRCGSTFCGAHRYPEEHVCFFVFKALGRDEIARANPLVRADKIERF